MWEFTHKERMREGDNTRRGMLASSVGFIMSPSPSIYRQGVAWKSSKTPPGCDKGPIRDHHMESQDQLALRWFGRTHGSADPLWAPASPSFPLVAGMWALGYISGMCNILRWFGGRVGPWILVTSMWRILIHWSLPPLD